MTQKFIPSANERISLKVAGLGEKKLRFVSNDSSRDFQEKLYEEYPKLVDGGSFELL